MNQMKIFKIIVAATMVIVISSCSLLEPEPQNIDNFDRVMKEPSWADGLLLNGYVSIQGASGNVYRWDEVATDDAVSNDPTNGYRQMASGRWSASNNSQSVWSSCYTGILHINQFLSIVDDVTFRVENQQMDALYKRRLKGEAYALRGVLQYYLLRNHAGVGTNNELLGTPIYNEFLDIDADFKQPRDKFENCVESAYQDFDKAIELLPFDYFDLKNVNDFPNNYSDLTTGDQKTIDNNIVAYNFTCGNRIRQRISGRITLAFKMRLALLHASPAFNLNNNTVLWETVADIAGQLLDEMKNPAILDPVGHIFYLRNQVDACDLSANPSKDLPEHLWRKPKAGNSAYELANFPPSLEGNGRINPTQNLVDAFPMLNGYPINHSASGYDPRDPYKDRDPRLARTVVYNGAEIKSGKLVNTAVGSGIDGLGFLPTSTRTGYYLRKLLRSEVTIGTTTNPQDHIDPFIRYTEVFLTYAEAANEAYGPTGGPKSYNAKSIISEIRKRGGIEETDPYLASITSKEDMRQMIRNERRLELSFESFRFWDLRRWNISLIEPAKGMSISEAGVYTVFEVEPRDYKDFMIYGPIPKTEVDNFNFIQNKGW